MILTQFSTVLSLIKYCGIETWHFERFKLISRTATAVEQTLDNWM